MTNENIVSDPNNAFATDEQPAETPAVEEQQAEETTEAVEETPKAEEKEKKTAEKRTLDELLEDVSDDDATSIRAMVEKARREAASYRTKLREAEKSEQIVAETQGELSEVRARAEKAEQELLASRLEVAKLTAAAEHGLTPEDMELVGGSTPEEISERSKKLAERLGAGPATRQPIETLRSGSARAGEGAVSPDPLKLAADLWRR